MRGWCGLALVALPLLASSCDGRLDFDSKSGVAGGGAAGQASGGGQSQAGGGAQSQGGTSNVACAAGLRFSSTAQLCVECVEDGDCAALDAKRCLTSPSNVANRCVDCVADQDCSMNERCVAVTHTCAKICDIDDDPRCDPVKEECSLRTGYCAACRDDDECWRVSIGYHCGPGGAICVQCTVDADCSGKPGPLCDQVLFRCVDCRDNRDCKNSQSCDPLTHTCF
jgi:hypothetical protein